MLVLTRRQKAHVYIHNAAIFTGGIGAGWLGELWLVPDAIPLGLLQAGMVLGLARLFLIRPVKGALLGLVAAFCTSLLGRGLSMALFLRFPEQDVAINVLCAVLLTEGLGWLCYKLFRARRAARLGRRDSLLVEVMAASRHGPLKLLVWSAPMLFSLAAALAVPNVKHLLELRLRAPDAVEPLLIDYGLFDRREGRVLLSGVPRGGAERVQFQVHNPALRAQLDRTLVGWPPPRLWILAWVPRGAGGQTDLVVDDRWGAEVRLVSDYWRKVKGRLYLLILGLISTGAMIFIGHHRLREKSGAMPVPLITE